MSRGRLLGLAWCWVVLGLAFPVFGGSGGWVEFTNETGSRLTATPSLGTNDVEEKDYHWGDLDQDGDTDLVCVRKTPFTSNGPRANVLFMNEGGVLVDRTAEFASFSDVPGDNGFMTPTNDRDVQVVDLNGDGWLDVVTATTLADNQPKHLSHPRIYINQGVNGSNEWLGLLHEDARMPEMHCCNGSNPHAPRFCSVAVADMTGDGAPDLYFGDYDSGGGQTLDFNNKLLINDGNGNFSDQTNSRLTFTMRESAFGAATEIHDMNGDGGLDVVKQTALNPPQHVAITYNTPANTGFFTDYDIVYTLSPYHIEVDDLNNDGMMDIAIADDFQDTFLLNTGNGGDGLANFQQKSFTYQTGGDDGFGSNIIIGDLNNDGFNDVLIADVDVDIGGCNRRLHLYRNLGDVPSVTLQEQGGAAPWTPTGVHDVALIDLNDDGWLDMVIGRCSGTEIWMNEPPVGLTFSYPGGLPAFVPPSTGLTFEFEVNGAGGGVPTPGTGEAFVSINDGPFNSIPVNDLGGNLYETTLPATSCGTKIEWYVTADLQGGGTESDPSAGVADPYVAISATGTEVFLIDEVEGPVGDWQTVADPGLATGAWEQADPNGTFNGQEQAAPEDDATAGTQNTMCWVTANGAPGGAAGAADVDGGFARLITPALDFGGSDGTISWSQWFYCNDEGGANADFLTIDISNNDGATWSNVGTVSGTASSWETATILVSEFVTPTSQVRVRFSVADLPNNSLTEAGIDNLSATIFTCGPQLPTFKRGDVSGDGVQDISDPILLLAHLFIAGSDPLVCEDAADGDDSGALGLPDAIAVLNSMFGAPATPLPAPYPGCGSDPTDGDVLTCDNYTGCP